MRHAKSLGESEIQDCGPAPRPGQVPVYHTHGLRQYMGTCKIHKFSSCAHLTNWTPGSGLGKTIMREWEDDYSKVPESARCKTCFTNPT